MPVTPSGPEWTGIVTRLRAAGCVFADEEARLLFAAATTRAHLGAMVQARADGLALELVIGWAEFCGLRIAVEPGVFVPRRRTEFLARQAAAVAAGQAAHPGAGGARPGTPTGPHRASRGPVPLIVELCCGSGAIGAALMAILGQVDLHAVDIDPVAVRCARRNLAGASVYEGDLCQPLPQDLRGRADIVVANVPYVPTAEIALLPAEARAHEPRAALDGGPDGLSVLRRVSAEAPAWLRPGGSLLAETSQRQAGQAAAILSGAGLSARLVTSEELAVTVVIGVSPEPPRRGAPE